MSQTMVAVRSLSVLAVVMGLVLANCRVSSAEETGAPASTKSPAALPDPAEATAPIVKITGFRSAAFGSDEASVRADIVKDFGVPEKAIEKSQNLADRTDILTAKVPDVLPGGGTAEVAYAFGYKSKKLTQVSVIWSRATDKSLTAERLLANAEALKTYFAAAGYDPKSVAANAAVHDGILLFRGADAVGHTTALMLHGATTTAKDKTSQTFVPNALLLFYLADPKTPDVFKIPPGRF